MPGVGGPGAPWASDGWTTDGIEAMASASRGTCPDYARGFRAIDNERSVGSCCRIVGKRTEASTITDAQRGAAGPTLALAIAAPLGTLALAYAAWAITDRLLYIGPLDRAQFGWLVVVPLLCAAPVVAVLVWRDLPDARRLIASGVVAVAIGGTAALLFGTALVDSLEGCQAGSRLPATDVVLGIVVVGLVTGAGYAGSGAIGAHVWRKGHPWLGGAIAAVSGFATLWAAAFVAFGVFGGIGICNRPTPI
jgi:hypothetical protein